MHAWRATDTQAKVSAVDASRSFDRLTVSSVSNKIDIGEGDPESLQFGARLTRTLPRSFKLHNAQFFRVRNTESSVPTLDREMFGEPTSPLKPPETDDLRPPKAKLKIPLRMKLLRGEMKDNRPVQEKAPEPMNPTALIKSTTTQPRYNSRTGTYIRGRSTLRRHL